jgi:hypothetical protein
LAGDSAEDAEHQCSSPTHLASLHRNDKADKPGQATVTATELGYDVAERVLPEPPKVPTANMGAAFIEHDLALNEFYVRLIEVPLKAELAALRAQAQQEANPAKAFDYPEETEQMRDLVAKLAARD